MTCFFYKLNAETAEFESVSFDKEETCLVEFKELIIKNKFENTIGLKELDVIDYNSRKKFSDKDVLKNNSYFIVSKIPKLTLSTKNSSSQSSQVATIQPYITSEVSKIETETPKTNYCYEHPTTFTTSTVFTNKPENDPLYCFSQPQQMIVINPHHQPYHLHHSQPSTYIYSAPEAYIQPALYQPHVYPTPLAFYPPYFPHLSNPIYPSHQFSQFSSEKEGRSVDKFYEGHHKRSPHRTKPAYSSHRHEKVYDKISRHSNYSSRYGSQRDGRRRSDSRRRERRRSHSKHHRREHKYHRHSRERHYSREKKGSKGIKYSKERKKEERNYSRYDKESKESKVKISKDKKKKCKKGSDDDDDDKKFEVKIHHSKHSCSDDEDDDSKKLKSVLSISDGGITECDKEMLNKEEDMKEDVRSLTERNVEMFTRNTDKTDVQNGIDDNDEHERCKDGGVSDDKNRITITNKDKTLIKKLSSDCVNELKKVHSDVKSDDKEVRDSIENKFPNDIKKQSNTSQTKQLKQSQRKKDFDENENKTSSSLEDNKNIASCGTRKTQIRTVSNQLSLNI